MSETPKRKSRSARISGDLDIVAPVPVYDRGSDSTKLQYGTSQRRKVQILQMLIVVFAAWFAALVNSDVPVTILAPLKVVPVFLMVAVALTLGGGRSYGKRVAVGLVFCVVGNVCFELEGMAHVPSFLIGMLFFVAGLCAFSYAFMANDISMSVLRSAPPVAYAAIVFSVLWPTVPTGMVTPVLVYAMVIAALLALAFSRHPDGIATLYSWRCASAGAVMFTATSTILGYDRFVSSVPYAKLIFTVCYYLAQFLITMSVRGAEARGLTMSMGSVENFQTGQGFRTES